MTLLSNRQIAVYAAVATVAIEIVTDFLRFGLGFQCTRDTASTIGVLTMGLRIHHGYVGVPAIIIGAVLWQKRPPLSRWILVAGIALAASDLIHHFFVMWPVTGDAEFHLWYPATPS